MFGVGAYIGFLPDHLLLPGFVMATVCIPISRFEDGASLRSRSVKAIYSAGLIIIALLAVVCMLTPALAAAGGILLGAYLIALIIYMWTSGGWS